MFNSVLVANRGEIAVRILAACQEMGIRGIAVYSEVDRNAAHVRAADEAICIGAAPALESYLNIEAIIAAAKATGAEALHPGYGFLSENAEFAEACAAAGLVFIGPPPEAMRLMGSKTAAKRAVAAAGVPTVPGYNEDGASDAVLEREAERIGYPLMLKAAAGGGGKGMRVVMSASAFLESLQAARREALGAFGDDTIFLERLVEAPRHIEFQILADQYGHVIHLGERECSIQRRHQKIIEESPSVALAPSLRAEMGDAAVRAASAAGYVNAGTCEFLLDRDGAFYFLEMNTRLQVEHPVTELVNGVDLVRLQLEIAAGEHLSLTQNQISPRGHAIEARLYAEDPAQGYLPSTGTVSVFDMPRAPGVRIDAGIAAGDDVTMYYDPMLAKIIVAAPDRDAAVQRLRWALDRCAVLGIATNLPLLRAIASETDFQQGKTSTAYLDQHPQVLSANTQGDMIPPVVALAAATYDTVRAVPASRGVEPFNPWRRGSAPGGTGALRFRYTQREIRHVVTLFPNPDGSYRALLDDMPYPAENIPVAVSFGTGGQVMLSLGALRERCFVSGRGHAVLVSWHGHAYALNKPRPLDVDTSAHEGEFTGGSQALAAPMAGTVIKVLVSDGERVEAQQTLVVLGAMKMEHAIVAPYDGVVVRVTHAAGDVVSGGEVLVEVEGVSQETRDVD